MADNSQDLFSDQNFDASNFDSNGGPGPVPKKKYTASGKLITDKTPGVVGRNQSVERSKILEKVRIDTANDRAVAQQIQANAAQKQKQKEVQQYAPTNIVDEAVMSEVGETKYLEYQKDKERLDQLKDKQFSTLIGKNFESFRKTLSDVDTRKNDGDPLTYLLNVGKDIVATTASAVGALAKAGYDKYTKNQFTEKEEIELAGYTNFTFTRKNSDGTNYFENAKDGLELCILYAKKNSHFLKIFNEEIDSKIYKCYGASISESLPSRILKSTIS